MDIPSAKAAPVYALDLYPNGALLFDPHFIGKIKWPNPPALPATLNTALTEILYDLLADETYRPANSALHSLFYLAGTISFNISFYQLAHKAMQNRLSGFYFDLNKPFITAGSGDTSSDKTGKVSLKDFVAVKGQKVLLRLVGMCGIRPQLATAYHPIYDRKKFGRIYRLRRPEAIMRVERENLNDNEKLAIRELAKVILSKASAVLEKLDMALDESQAKLLNGYVEAEISKAYQDLEAIRNFFKNISFIYYERSLSAYLPSLVSTVCRENGGAAHSTFHGVCQTASEPDVVTMANSSVFWGVTDAFTLDANELAQRIPPGLRKFEIGNMEQEAFYKAYLKNDEPRKQIKRVAIMGRHIVMRYSAFNALEFPAYLDLENKMSRLLADNGYEVTYKAHPECDWRYFDHYFDPRVKIDWRSFEPVMDEFDALFFHFGASSTMPHALGSHLHIFMVQDGWHDIKIWPSRIQKFYRQYCNMLPARIGDDSLIHYDDEEVLKVFKTPVSFDKEQRIKDFFCKKY